MQRKGFSLVELLVVIGVIAVLIAILKPALRKARMSAHQVSCSSNLRQIMLGINPYAKDYPGAMARGTFDFAPWPINLYSEPRPGLVTHYHNGSFNSSFGDRHVESLTSCVHFKADGDFTP